MDIEETDKFRNKHFLEVRNHSGVLLKNSIYIFTTKNIIYTKHFQYNRTMMSIDFQRMINVSRLCG